MPIHSYVHGIRKCKELDASGCKNGTKYPELQLLEDSFNFMKTTEMLQKEETTSGLAKSPGLPVQV